MNSKLIVVCILLFIFFISAVKSSPNKSKNKNFVVKKIKENEILPNFLKILNIKKPAAEFVDTLTESLKNEYLRILAQIKSNFVGYSTEREVHILAALFHYKTLTWEIIKNFDEERKKLMRRKENEIDEEKYNESEKIIDKNLEEEKVKEMDDDKKIDVEFRQRLHSIKMEHVNLSIEYRNENWENLLCIFYKFFLRLNYDTEMRMNKEWNAYFNHKFRHFIWIDLNTLSAMSDVKKWGDRPEINFKVKNCTEKEIRKVQEFIQWSPQKERAHFWSLHWMLKNSKDLQNFIEEDIRNIKNNLVTLFGIAALDRMEYAFPDMLQIYTVNASSFVSKYRRLFLSPYPIVVRCAELEFALRFFYSNLVFFINKIEQLGSKEFEYFLEKIVRIRQNVVNNLQRIVEGFEIDDDYENILRKCVCILMQFSIIHTLENLKKSIAMIENMDLDDLLQICDKEKYDFITKIRPLLQDHHFKLVGQLLTNDKGMQEMFKKEFGVIYKFKDIIGENTKELQAFWLQYSSYMHDEEYFKKDVNIKIQESYKKFFTLEDKNEIQKEKLNTEIFVTMKWIENFMNKTKMVKKYKDLLDLLRFHARNDLDMGYMLPEESWRLDCKMAIVSGKLMKFLKNYAKKLDSVSEEQICEDWLEKLNISIAELIKIGNNKEKPKNEPSIQMLHVNEMEIMAKKANKNNEKDKFNFWNFLSNLHLDPKGIMQIFEFIDIDHVEILFEKLQIKFNKEKFEKYTTYISKSEKEKGEKQIEIREQLIGLKDKEKGNSNLKSKSKNIRKEKLKTNLMSIYKNKERDDTDKSKELVNFKIGTERKERKEMAMEKIKILFNIPSKVFIQTFCKEKGYNEVANYTKYAKQFEFFSDEYEQGEIVKIKPDGNCGFRSLSYALTGTEDNHKKMRKDILEYLKNALENYQNGMQADDWCVSFNSIGYLEEHIRVAKFPADNAGNEKRWMENVDILAAAKLYNINIVVCEKLEQKCRWQIYSPTLRGDLSGCEQKMEAFSVFIYHSKNHFEIIKSPSKIEKYAIERGRSELAVIRNQSTSQNRRSKTRGNSREKIKKESKIDNKIIDKSTNSEKEERRGRSKTRKGNNFESKNLELKIQERMKIFENLRKPLEGNNKLKHIERTRSLSHSKSTSKKIQTNRSMTTSPADCDKHQRGKEENIGGILSSKNRSQNDCQSKKKNGDIWREYRFEDLMKFETLNMQYKELLKDISNHEQIRLTDITVFAFEIGQRLKALEIYTKLWPKNGKELENIQETLKSFTISTFKNVNKLEEALYDLMTKIEIAMGNPINLEKNEMANNKEKNIFEIRKQLHALRFAWIIQIDSNWQNAENTDINRILSALNLEDERKISEQIRIWKSISDQIKLDHVLYVERGIKGKGNEILDFVKYSQQLWFDGQHKKEEELTEKLIEEFKFVDVKDIENGKPIKYLWMQKYMQTKESLKDIVKKWHSTAEILFTGSHLLGTMTSRSDMDTIVVTHDVQIYDYNQLAKCIIVEEFHEQMKMQRKRTCENDQLFICKLCKMSRVISAVRTPGSLGLVRANFCEDDNYEFKSFVECKYKVEVDFLFATLLKKDHLSILKRKEVKSDEIDEILVELYRLYSSRASFLALLGLRDNIRILEQFPNDARNFRIACAALKLWAKRNNIYGPKLGFLKGIHMNLLMVKIYLRYPSASVSFLIEQFFATYIVWPWPMPVQLLQISKLTYEKSGTGSQNLLWYEKEPNAEMPIISPGFIESNKASDVDRYTKSIMRTFMSEGLKQIREIRAGKVKSSGENEWHDFMRGNDLAQRYAHYLVVNCLTKVSEGTFGDDFCAITSLKMHDFIPTDIGKLLPKEIRWYHIIEAGSRKGCFIDRDGYEDISKYKCDIWLVGLQLKKDKQIDPEEMINLENTKKMNGAKEKIYNDYYEYKKRFNKTIGEEHKNSLTENLLLSINYVGVQDLHKWNIKLRGWEINVKNLDYL